MSDPTPKGGWEDSGPVRPGCAWWNRLDGRYLVEVQYGDHSIITPRPDGLSDEHGTLCIFDNDEDFKLVHQEPTTIVEGARFGPDVMDIERWCDRAIEIVDGLA